MKKNLTVSIISVAVIGSIATSAFAGISDVSQTSSKQFSKTMQDSGNAIVGSIEFSNEKVFKPASTASSNAATASKNYIVKAVKQFPDKVVIVLTDSKNASSQAKDDSSAALAQSKDGIVNVFTESGNILQTSINESKTAIGVVLREIKDSPSVAFSVEVGGQVVGSIEASGDFISQKATDAYTFSMNASGEISAQSKQSKEDVKEFGKKVYGGVKFLVTETSEFISELPGKSVLALNASGQKMQELATDLGEAIAGSAEAVRVEVTASAQNSYVILKPVYDDSTALYNNSTAASQESIYFFSGKVQENLKRVTYEPKTK